MMKKLLLVHFLLAAIVPAAFGTALAGSICVDTVGRCNDFKVTYTKQSAGIYEFNGFEYGCGEDDRMVTGTAHVVDGGVAYNFQKNGNSDSAQYTGPFTSGWVGFVSFSGWRGPFDMVETIQGFAWKDSGELRKTACPSLLIDLGESDLHAPR